MSSAGLLSLAARRPRVRRATRLDVAFHVPSVATLVSSTAAVPSGGAETQIYLIARELARRGLRVGLVCYVGDGELPAELDGMRLISRPPSRGDRRLVGALLESALVMRTIFTVDATTYVQRMAGFYTGLVALAARLRGRRFVYSSASVVDFDLASYGRGIREQLLFRLGAALAAEIVVQTEEQAALCRTRLHREPILIPSITETEPRRSGEPTAFLWIGRADPCKRPLDFVALAKAVPEAQFRMVLLRNGASAVEVGEEVDRAAASVSNLEVSGGITRLEVGGLMDRAVALVSTSEYEGMPNVFLEAWARGVPVVAMHHDPDGVIERERIGHFVDGSAERLADRARALWRTRTDQEALALRCTDYVERRHAPAAVGERWTALLSARSGRAK